MSDSAGARQDAERLARYFSDDKRFDFLGLIAHGNYGSASRVQYRDTTTKMSIDFIVKRAFSSQMAEDAMRRERDYLRRFRGALHIVQMIEVENNPLNRQPSIAGQWITMEWLSCGSLSNFIAKAKTKVNRLPNRLLWRFFLCLVRACIAMANPPNRDDGIVEREVVRDVLPKTAVAHGDFHAANVVLGEPPSDSEHTITPILKVIDFGNASEWSWIDGMGTTANNNLWEVGKFMIGLITLSEREFIPRSGRGKVMMPNQGKVLTTDAVAILPLDPPNAKFPLLDPDLGRLVCWCLATDIEDGPSLWDIDNRVGFFAGSKRPMDYPNRPEETDDHISRLWRQIVYNADT
ncbi:kinase-like domain-containing protein [Daldinia caldariorum]|uniref:kinase-like domain-containing protein n=1 Tax=Daldinia caldariorum TaxID=326644 RepID=UPI0020081E5F|nr:kinase-like domain-containing protein [Daldinia caldariorum]KAI1473211.1 kinase-like domain-containing protein [Daldinia caldariorum]